MYRASEPQDHAMQAGNKRTTPGAKVPKNGSSAAAQREGFAAAAVVGMLHAD